MLKAITTTVLLSLLAFFATAEKIYVDGKEFYNLEDAKSAIEDGSTIHLKAGFYSSGLYLSQSNIQIIGEPNVIFDNVSVDGKAAFVLTGDNVFIESITCTNIQVKDLNGACIRFEGNNLTARNIHVEDSQSGIMTSQSNGYLKVEYSTFNRIGGKAKGRGYSHAIYAKVKELIFENSSITSTKGEGSGIKSRSERVLVNNSLIASLDAKDSRLIDAAEGGELIIRNSVLQQGNASSNSQLIAFALEKRTYSINHIEMTNNLLFLDREKANVIVADKGSPNKKIINNVFVGDFLYPSQYIKNNSWYISREKAKLQPYPYIPGISERSRLMRSISALGEQE